MIITVDRFKSDSDATISNVNVDGQFVCFGLEDEFRAEKVANEISGSPVQSRRAHGRRLPRPLY